MKWRIVLLGIVVILFGAWAIILWKIAPNTAITQDSLQGIRTVPSKMLIWKEIASYPLPSTIINGITVDASGRIYVASEKSVLIFTPGKPSPQVILIGETPNCVAVSKTGTIYAGIRGHIETITPPTDTRVDWRPPESNAQIINLALKGFYLYAADAGNKLVWKYDLSGHVLGTIGRADPAKHIKGFLLPSPHLDITVKDNGDLIINDPGRHRVDTFTSTGGFVSSFGNGGNAIDEFCGCCNPIRIALLPSGDIVTAEKGLPRVKALKPDGTLDSVIMGPKSFSPNTEDIPIATDTNGRVYIADIFAKRLRVFTRK